MDAIYAREHGELVADLKRSGLYVVDIWSWVNGSTPIAAEPILLRHLERCTHERLKEGITRALMQKSFKNTASVLIEQFATSLDDSTRWAMAHAVAYLGFPKKSWPQILALASNRSYGRGRQYLVQRLHRIKLPQVEPLLIDLVDDPDVDAFAVSALGRCGGIAALERLRNVDATPRSPLFRRELAKAVSRLSARLAT